MVITMYIVKENFTIRSRWGSMIRETRTNTPPFVIKKELSNKIPPKARNNMTNSHDKYISFCPTLYFVLRGGGFLLIKR